MNIPFKKQTLDSKQYKKMLDLALFLIMNDEQLSSDSSNVQTKRYLIQELSEAVAYHEKGLKVNQVKEILEFFNEKDLKTIKSIDTEIKLFRFLGIYSKKPFTEKYNPFKKTKS